MIVLLTACGKEDLAEKEKKYAEMEATLKEYFEQYYEQAIEKFPEEVKNSRLRVALGGLKEQDFDISSIVNIDTGKPCDLEGTYAIIDPNPDKEKYPDTKYLIDVYLNVVVIRVKLSIRNF